MIWLIGNKGMLGTELSLLLEKNGFSFTGTDMEVDITDQAALERFANGKPITWIINCAAYTAVDRAEDDEKTCRRLNTLGAANIARCAKNTGSNFIHFSTDYVFNGKGITANGTTRPYREEDDTDPIGVYGLTKRDGETEILKENEQSYIIRTAWLYGKYGNNFVKTMIKLMNERDEIKVVDDQRGSPTWAFDLAFAALALVKAVDSGKNIPFGIYHYTNGGNITWFDFAGEIYRLGREQGVICKDCSVKPCGSAEYPAKVKRPAYSVLDKTKIKQALDIEIPDWKNSLKKYLELTAEQ